MIGASENFPPPALFSDGEKETPIRCERGQSSSSCMQDVGVGSCAPPMCPEHSYGERAIHITRQEKSSAPVTHSLALLFNTSRSCRLTSVRGWIKLKAQMVPLCVCCN